MKVRKTCCTGYVDAWQGEDNNLNGDMWLGDVWLEYAWLGDVWLGDGH